MNRFTLSVTLIVAATFCISSVSGIKLSDYRSGRWFSGEGTYYGAGGTEGGNCAMRSPRPAWMSSYVPVAINNAQYPRSCGACVEIHGSGRGLGANPITGKILGVIVDRCPECAHGDIDLSKDGDGRWDIKWKLVPCNKRGDIEFQFEGSNAFYRKIQPRNTRSPPVKVTIDGVAAKKSQDNHWIAQKGSGFSRKYTVQVWTITGEYYKATLNKYHGVVHPISGGGGKKSTKFTSSSSSSPSSFSKSSSNTCVPEWDLCSGSDKCCGSHRCLLQRNSLGHKWTQCVEPPREKSKSKSITRHSNLCRSAYERCGDSYKWRTWNGGWYFGSHCCTGGYHCRKAYKNFGGYRCEPDRRK